MAEPTIRISTDGPALATDVADWLTEKAAAHAGRFAICLSGGSTPKSLYEKLAADPYKSRFPWDRSHWFFGDERFVPHSEQDSNYRMAREALLDHVPIPNAQIYPIPDHPSPAQAAHDYQQILQQYYGSQALNMSRPLFDVVLMGLGEDGHTASLFPGNPALENTLDWVTDVTDPSVPQPRITLTFPTLACSDTMAFLVEGEKKRHPLQRVLNHDRSAPAARASAINQTIWFVDKTALP